MKSNFQKALITGITGQDGSFLTRLLLSKGYEVVGVTNQKDLTNFEKLGIDSSRVKFISFEEIPEVIEDGFEIYNYAGQSSVGQSWKNPLGTFEVNVNLYINLIESVRSKKVKILQASSSEMFGDVKGTISETTKLNPQNPYGLSKLTAHKYGQIMRKSEGFFITNVILFNHESKLRDARFVTRKIIDSAIEISEGKKDFLELGNIDVVRDWGLAEDYVEAMWKLMQLEDPEDIIVASGKSISLRDYIKMVFEYLKIENYEKYIKINQEFIRSNEVMKIEADVTKLNSFGIELSPINSGNIHKLIS